MGLLILQFLGGAAAVVLAGVFLTRYADVIGEKSGLGRTLAGALLLATATSLPELTVDCNLARSGEADLIMGDLFGSSLFNLLILAVLDLVHRGPSRMMSQGAAAHALSAAMTIALTALALLFLIAPFEGTIVGGIGPGPIVLAVSYVLGLRLVYYDQQFAMKQLDSASIGMAPVHDMSLTRATIGYAACALGVFLAAPVLASAAEGLAEATGLGGTFIGSTLVAMSTSTPEAVTAYAAVRMGAFDLAVGNILGSNAFNITITLPADAFFEGSLLAAASPTHAVTATCVILVTTITVMGLLYRPERRYWFVEPNAAFVVAGVLVSLGLVFYMR
jgi:cation:H+ antiporter